MRFIQFIADYGKKDPAFAEVMQRLMMEVPDAVISETSVAPFSTVETGFWTAQFAAAAACPEGMIVYTNTAPRKDDLEVRAKNQGEGLAYARLKNGVEVVGVNSGYSFSFLKNFIEELWVCDVEIEGSQFRSRDFFPKVVGKTARKDYSFKKTQLQPSDLPDFPVGVIGAIDGYGNIKTTWRAKDVSVPAGAKVKVRIGQVVAEAIYADGTFEVQDGQLALAAGSSGHEGNFLEVFLRGGSAQSLFEYPRVESKVEILA